MSKKEESKIEKKKPTKKTSNTKNGTSKIVQKKPQKIEVNKKGNTRKEVKKEHKGELVKMFNKITATLKSHFKITIGVVVLLLISIVILIASPIISMNQKVISINNTDYTKSDFMIYLYSVKYNYFGKDNTDLPEATLNTLVDENDDLTIREYLKEKTVTEIKTAGAIQKLANDYKITLSSKDLAEIAKEKEEFINSLGGKKEFKKMLKDNNTNEEAYDRMAKSDKLYKVIFDEMYSNGKTNDLTASEKSKAKEEYYNEYKKIRQIVLSTIDLNTNKNLNETTINQKETLANTILNEARNGANFDELIKKYSETAIGVEPPYSVYYKSGQILEEIEKAVNELDVGEISDIVKSKYALHIIIRDALDDEKLENIYNQKREEKLLENISNTLKEVPIIYHNAFTNIKIS